MWILCRVKPVGNSEEYLSKLLQRFDSEEMQQVTEKKLYEHPPANLSQQGVADFLEDAIAELTLETLEDTYETIPRYNLPEQYRAPNLGQEVEDMLNSSDSDKPSYLKSEPKLTGPPPRGKCKVCRGMKLEPMV